MEDDGYYSDEIEVEYMDGNDPNSPVSMGDGYEAGGVDESRRLAALDVALSIMNKMETAIGANQVISMAKQVEGYLRGSDS